ncbi:alpha/beta-Hydrolases superfamily protein [Striga asiatica]|uniref:Alpha/beta-Hydrolases superfamily protein n=1 Tax=Striga asiatica TaxID=4170 RepID=A0A5A7P8L1_STRAF|nr:alpha/beta-Hydrolases superfamily protein [Striga asiatica]
MAARKISAASARTHTRGPKATAASKFSGILRKVLLVGFVGLLAWAYQATRPPPPKICGWTNGPPITAPRVHLKDGRHIAYQEVGVPKETAKHKIVFIHGFDSCRHHVSALAGRLSPDIIESEGIYIVSFDRPGYGESDPHPTRTVKSLALDIEELADQLGLGPKFYVVGFSMGGQVVWSCLKYIPHSFYYTKPLPIKGVVRQQGEFESLHRDLMIGFGKWEFDPTDIENPFSNGEGSVHLWQGDEDRLVPVALQRYIVDKLPWIQYHELQGAGHMILLADGISDSVVQALPSNLENPLPEVSVSVMAAGPSRKISAASARAHTRRPKAKTASKFSDEVSVFSHRSEDLMIGCCPISENDYGIFKKILVVVFVGLLALAYQAIRPPSPKMCGSANGPPVTASRVQLRDGRYLAYQEFGVPKEIAKHKIVFIHGFRSCRHDVSTLTAYLSPDIVENDGISIISFDRPGYGESDPHPTRTVKSLALDIEELADQLSLGSKFYVIGFSMGGQIVWSCLKYIPHRLAGAALIAPVVNYWWLAFPSNLSRPAYLLQPKQDQWALRVAHYLPWLTYWWNTQRFFPVSSVIAGDLINFSDQDKELLPRLISIKKEYQEVPTQQGEFESLHRDTMIGFGKWEFDPTDIENPFPNGEGSVHLWQGDEDRLVPVSLQRYIAEKLPWIHYHELAGAGHMFLLADGRADSVVEALVA